MATSTLGNLVRGWVQVPFWVFFCRGKIGTRARKKSVSWKVVSGCSVLLNEMVTFLGECWFFSTKALFSFTSRFGLLTCSFHGDKVATRSLCNVQQDRKSTRLNSSHLG